MFSGGIINSNSGGKEKSLVVGFWKRALADALDTWILGIFGFAVTVPFRNFFYKFGEDGIWIGLVITFLYTGILQSSIGKGQSLAKKLLKIEVTGLDGNYMGLFRSFLRCSVLVLLFYNSSIYAGLKSLFPFFAQPLPVFIFSSLAITVFTGCAVLLPLHPLKRGIQDLIAGSVVVRAGQFDAEKIAELNDSGKTKRAFIIWIVITVLICGADGYLLSRKNTWTELISLTDLVIQRTELRNPGIGMNIQFATKDHPKQKTLTINGFLPKERYDQDSVRELIFTKTAKLAAENNTEKDLDYIVIQIRSGYNIGIANLSFYQGKVFTAKGDPVIFPEEEPAK